MARVRLSLNAIRRRLAGMSLCRIQNGTLDGICMATSRDNRSSVRFGIPKLRLPHVNDSEATKQ